jgi:hypothetical protein
MSYVTPTRLIVGFIAGFVSVFVFSSGGIAILAAVGAGVPFPAWSMAPVPPFGVPQTVSAAFWGGLWGVAYALLEPRFTARFGWWLGGLVFGVLPLLVLWFVAFPLKGIPIGGGFTLSGVLMGIFLHAVFGVGTAIFFRFSPRLAGQRKPLRSTTRMTTRAARKQPMTKTFISTISALALLSASTASGQTALAVQTSANVLPLAAEEPTPRLFVDAPLAGPLAQGKVFIHYRTENLRIAPVFGPNALDVSPRVGHLHVTVDDAPWHWADVSGAPLILVGFAPGPHKVEIILANTNHQPLDRAVVEFVIPEGRAAHRHQ